jgi:hypothetical protein
MIGTFFLGDIFLLFLSLHSRRASRLIGVHCVVCVSVRSTRLVLKKWNFGLTFC